MASWLLLFLSLGIAMTYVAPEKYRVIFQFVEEVDGNLDGLLLKINENVIPLTGVPTYSKDSSTRKFLVDIGDFLESIQKVDVGYFTTPLEYVQIMSVEPLYDKISDAWKREEDIYSEHAYKTFIPSNDDLQYTCGNRVISLERGDYEVIFTLKNGVDYPKRLWLTVNNIFMDLPPVESYGEDSKTWKCLIVIREPLESIGDVNAGCMSTPVESVRFTFLKPLSGEEEFDALRLGLEVVDNYKSKLFPLTSNAPSRGYFGSEPGNGNMNFFGFR